LSPDEISGFVADLPIAFKLASLEYEGFGCVIGGFRRRAAGFIWRKVGYVRQVDVSIIRHSAILELRLLRLGFGNGLGIGTAS